MTIKHYRCFDNKIVIWCEIWALLAYGIQSLLYFKTHAQVLCVGLNLVMLGSSMLVSYEPRTEKTCLCHMQTTKGADKPAHLHTLISAFVVHCLDSIIPLLAIADISRS